MTELNWWCIWHPADFPLLEQHFVKSQMTQMDREAWRAVIHGLQRVGYNWVTELNWTEVCLPSLWYSEIFNSLSSPFLHLPNITWKRLLFSIPTASTLMQIVYLQNLPHQCHAMVIIVELQEEGYYNSLCRQPHPSTPLFSVQFSSFQSLSRVRLFVAIRRAPSGLATLPAPCSPSFLLLLWIYFPSVIYYYSWNISSK